MTMGRVLSVSRWLLLAAFCFSSPPTAGQRISTVEIEGRSYYISAQSPYNAPLSWFLAYQYCRTIGMELLTEDSQEDAQVLRTFLNNNGYGRQSFWTSGNQLGSSQWLWMTSGQPYNTSFTYWAPAAKLTSSNEQCMLLDAEQWKTASCTQPHHFICQITRCYFFNYVRSNPPSTNDTEANSRTR
ncbi:C-type lectin domain family 4 member A-like isoform X2 [Hyalella azteca]|nr:C-type lectin domain family 4 member A-like isoform X2 [Hyalella azteca]